VSDLAQVLMDRNEGFQWLQMLRKIVPLDERGSQNIEHGNSASSLIDQKVYYAIMASEKVQIWFGTSITKSSSIPSNDTHV
jgi:hypothetical protein